jgi:hypothetical protein
MHDQSHHILIQGPEHEPPNYETLQKVSNAAQTFTVSVRRAYMSQKKMRLFQMPTFIDIALTLVYLVF